ncbi:hypothetical protein Tco_1264128 [Tanacetum coccineum]
MAEMEVSTTDPVTTASPTETTIADDLTIAQTLIEIRSAKSNVKGVVIGERSESTTRTRPQQLPSKDKAKLEEEDRLVRQREEEANSVSWDNVQAMIDVDYQMAQQMQVEEQEKLSIKEKSKLGKTPFEVHGYRIGDGRKVKYRVKSKDSTESSSQESTALSGHESIMKQNTKASMADVDYKIIRLGFMEEPVEIMDREVKRLKQSRIPIVKVRWNSRRGPEFTWEREDQFQKKYPHLFTKPVPSSSVAT